MGESRSALSRVLEPRVIAVVGASPEELKVGGRVLKSILRGGFDGDVFAVNPKYDQIMGFPCVASLEDVPGPIDLVVIALPNKVTLSVIEQAKALGAGGAFLCAGGFAEVGEAGQAMQEGIANAATPTFRLLGPNTQGFVNTTLNLSVNFSHRFVAHPPDPLNGDVPVAVVSQGGGAGSVLYEVAHAAGLEITHYVPTGNEVDIELSEVAEFLITERGVKHVMIMAEMLRNPRRLRAVADRAAKLGAGLSLYVTAKRPLGALAAASHTASLGTQAAALEAFAEQAGIVSVDSVAQLAAAAALQVRSPKLKGPRVGVLTNSGSAAVMISDACDEFGLQVPPLSKRGAERANEVAARGHIQLHNPLDVSVTDSPAKLHPLLVELVELEKLDAIAIAVANQYDGAGADIDQIVNMIKDVVRDAGVPVVPMWLSGEPRGLALLRNAHVPVFEDVREGMTALGQMWKATNLSSQAKENSNTATPAARAHAVVLTAADLADEYVSKESLGRVGLSVPRAIVVTSVDEAANAAASLGPGSVVLKAVRAGLLHKTELGLVKVGVAPGAVPQAFSELIEAVTHAESEESGAPFTLVVEEMVQGAAVELLASVRLEPSVGWTLAIGWGGLNVELHDDVKCVSLPASRLEFEAALRSLRCFQLIEGYRGKQGGSIPAVLDALEKLGQLPESLPASVHGIEINPLSVTATQAVVLDVAIESGNGGE